MQIHMKSDRGEIEVFLCPEEEALNMGGGLTSGESGAEDTDSEATINSPLKIKKENGALDSQFSVSGSLLSTSTTPQPSTSQMGGSPPGPAQTWEAPSRDPHGGDNVSGSDNQAMKNALIWNTEDFGPIGNRFQQQTVDQDHHHGKFIGLSSRVLVFCDGKGSFISQIILSFQILTPILSLKFGPDCKTLISHCFDFQFFAIQH